MLLCDTNAPPAPAAPAPAPAAAVGDTTAAAAAAPGPDAKGLASALAAAACANGGSALTKPSHARPPSSLSTRDRLAFSPLSAMHGVSAPSSTHSSMGLGVATYSMRNVCVLPSAN